jgi:DNA repair exonuclease SbcCD ATPase subunit
MIQIKNLTVRNFMSVGNATQAINFDRKDLTLVLGENLDLGGDGSRNGTGKTTIINALSYVIYGNALTNIKKDNLINKTNGKNMLVSLEFNVGHNEYKIERGRKPNVIKFLVNNEEHILPDDTSQGESKETQEEIESIVGMSHDIFKHILALNTYTEPFLSLKAADQRTIIEQLLGITLLSEKAERVKELNRDIKTSITEEEARVRAINEANKRVEAQIESLIKRKDTWLTAQKEEIESIESAIDALKQIDIEKEITKHKSLAEWTDNNNKINEANKWIANIELSNKKLEKTLKTLEKEIESMKNHKCFACGSKIHDDSLDKTLKAKEKEKSDTALQLLTNESQYDEHKQVITNIGKLGKKPEPFYPTLEDALNHKNSLDSLTKSLDIKKKETDPYSEQIEEMKSQAIQVIDYNTLTELQRIQEHQEFLLKLLTNKDSFVRKKIIEQNLSYLNTRLTHYLEKIGLPHQVVFQNDLTVEITELGRDLDFDNLSRGERNRLILSLSWAFRDVWESLYRPINVMFIDELIDSGMDTQGMESSLALLKKMSRERSKSVWLVSHREELAGRVENVLKVVKEKGFTQYNNDVDMK